MELEEGQIIGSYRIVRAIGQGGMGTVYEVEHVELGVRYALKTFTFDPTNEASHALKTKFLEEGKVLARLKHPNIAHVFDLAFDEATQMPYFVMDLVTYEDGESYTAEDVDPNDIDEELVYRWFREVASALDYIHGEGIVHRDIKPSNLLLDKDAHVVLSDFGISRIFGGQLKSAVGAETTMVSKTGRGKLILGTMKYMAPEVSLGDEVMPEADAYALGVMTLRWLTGFYYSDNPGALGLLAKKKYHWVPVLARLLAPDPARRPQTYSDLVKQLKPLASGDAASSPRQKGVTAAAPSEGERSPLAKIVTILALAVACCGVAAGLYFGWQFVEDRTAKRDRQIAELRDQMRAREEAAAAKAKAEAEEEARRKAEEERLAAEKKAQEEAERKKAEENDRRRQEEERLAAEKKAREAMKNKPAPKPVETQKKQREFVVDGSLVEKKDYGPIPDRTYEWLRGGDEECPQRMNFQLANKAALELIPFCADSFSMSNDEWDFKNGRGWHKVKFTRPYWMTRTCVTVDQWREYAPNDCGDCREIEQAIFGRALLYRRLTRKEIDSYCAFLSEKYRSQLPKGYVFRLPTDAEWERALDVDAAIAKYDQPGKKEWKEFVSIHGETVRTKFAPIRGSGKTGPLGKFRDSGELPDSRYRIGGLSLPLPSGLFDLYGESHRVLDRFANENARCSYADLEIDPLHWVEKNGSGLVRWWERGRDYRTWDTDPRLCHLVLGPDLIREKTWEKKREMLDLSPDAAPRQARKFDEQKIPRKINKPREASFKRVGGREMVFCEIPKGKFNMSNVDGQAKGYHKVELTHPFWMTKFCVTADEWREFAPNDFNSKLVKSTERFFSKYPVCVCNPRHRWEAYCEFLTKRYGRLLPHGYVFRLPTEAEWEWALVADERGDARRLGAGHASYDRDIQNDFLELQKQLRVPRDLRFTIQGFLHTYWPGLYIGGRTRPTGFGVYDVVVCGDHDPIVLDTFDAKGDGDFFHANVSANLVYSEKEVDPVRYAGRVANCVMRRCGGTGRDLIDRRYCGCAHIVIAPNLLKPYREADDSDFPKEDYGGVFIGDRVTRVDQSSRHHGEESNSDKQFKHMVSRENVAVAGYDRYEGPLGFHTNCEASPWILLDLGKSTKVAGVSIESSHWVTAPLCIWVSDDGKHEKLVAREGVEHRRYRIDLLNKNVKGRYIRIGREPNAREDYFYLSKIVIYGKEK